jgi:hypothetical protein
MTLEAHQDPLQEIAEQRLSSDEFVRRAWEMLLRLPATESRLRTGPGMKQLFDEVLPLAGFVRAIETPARGVHCTYRRGNQNFDAEIELDGPEVERGFVPPRLWAEITVARHPMDYLHREALERNGFVFPGNNIKRTAPRRSPESRISNGAEVQDGDAFVLDAAARTIEAVRAKSLTVYPEPCVLIVSVEPQTYPNIHQCSRIASEVAHAVPQRQFAYVSLVHWPTNTMFFC